MTEDATADLARVLTGISGALLHLCPSWGPGNVPGIGDNPPPGHGGDISADRPRSAGHCKQEDTHCRVLQSPQYCCLTPQSPADCLTRLQQCRPPESRHCRP